MHHTYHTLVLAREFNWGSLV